MGNSRRAPQSFTHSWASSTFPGQDQEAGDKDEEPKDTVRSFREPAGVKLQTQEREEAFVSLPNRKQGEGGATQLRPSGTITKRGCRSLVGSCQPSMWELPLIFHTKRDPTTTSPALSSTPLSLALYSTSPTDALLPFSVCSPICFWDQRITVLLEGNSTGLQSKLLLKAGLRPKGVKEHPEFHVDVGATSPGHGHTLTMSLGRSQFLS